MAFLKKSVSAGILVLFVFLSTPAIAVEREGREPRQREPILRIVKKIIRVLVPAPQEDEVKPPVP